MKTKIRLTHAVDIELSRAYPTWEVDASRDARPSTTRSGMAPPNKIGAVGGERQIRRNSPGRYRTVSTTSTVAVRRRPIGGRRADPGQLTR